jgi:membrane fusion protein (multidrug efflux system)
MGLLLLGLLLVGCGGRGGSNEASGSESGSSAPDSVSVDADADPGEGPAGEAAPNGEEEEAVPVEVAVLGRGPIESVIRASANLEAESRVGVSAEAARRVVEIRVEEGNVVAKGDVLLRLQDDEQQSNVTRVKSQLERAQREHDRQQRLFQQELTTEKALSDAIYELDQQKIALADAERELSYTRVRAPIRGTITARLVNVGDQVQVGQHLFDMVDFESLVARIYVPEKNLREVKTGQTCRIWARAVQPEAYRGTVERISPVVDPQSGTIKVTVAVGGQPGLRPGLYVDVELITATNDAALLVPKRALIYDNDQIFLYRLVSGRRVERLGVVPKLASKDFIEPLGGLAEGDSVVIAGQAALKDGARVELVSERAPAGDDSGEGAPAASEEGAADESSTEAAPRNDS